MISDLDDTEIVDKYRELVTIYGAIDKMPKHINECKLKAPPKIPIEFRKGKLPSNLFFADFEFSLRDLLKYIGELKDMYGKEVEPGLKKKIDKDA